MFGSSSSFGESSMTTPLGSQSRPFGSSNPFGSSSGSSAFGGTSTGAFAQPLRTPFGVSTSAFGTSSVPGFGRSASFFSGGSMQFGHNDSFGGFGSSTRPTLGSNAFGSTNPFGALNQPTFGLTGTPGSATTTTSAFGASTIPPFGATINPASGTTDSFPFGSTGTSLFGGTGTTFGVSSRSAFSSTSIGTQSSSSGARTNAFMFGSRGPAQGSRLAKYSSAVTDIIDGKSCTLYLQSISAMPVCNNRNHEEFRWEDYVRGDKGGSSSAVQPAKNLSSSIRQIDKNPSPNSVSTISRLKPNPFSPANLLEHTSMNIFSNSLPSIRPNPFGQTNTNLFLNPRTPIAPNPFAPTISPSSSNPFSPTIPFEHNSATVIPANSFGHTTVNTLPSPVSVITASPVGPTSLTAISSLTPAISPSNINPFSPTIPFEQNCATMIPANSFGHTTVNTLPNPASMITASPVGQSSLTAISSLTPAISPCPTSPLGVTGSNPSPTFPVNPAGVNYSGQFGCISANASSSVAPSISAVASATASNPWGTLPPQLAQKFPSVHHGISRMPVAEKPTSIRVSTLSAPRHLSQRRISLPVRKYNARIDGPKVPFFMNDDETRTSLKANVLFTPRENPRLLIIRPIEQWPPTQSVLKDTNNPSENVTEFWYRYCNAASPDENGHSHKEADLSNDTISKHRERGAAIAYSADIGPLMPKLCHADHYTEPPVQELAERERVQPGFCSHVKDFVVGRHGYGSIKFDGETDVRRLDLESIIQFNEKEVIVYQDVSKKPPVGQGLNKAAEVTLLNIKCINKKTGEQYTEGPRVDKFKDMLLKKTEEQGAEFVYFDAVKGLWKFKVGHF